MVPSELETAVQASTLGGPRRQGVEAVEPASPSASTGTTPNSAPFARDVLPGDEVRVVLELGGQHEVARAEVVEPQA